MVCVRPAVSHVIGIIARRSVVDSRSIGGERSQGSASREGRLSPCLSIYVSVVVILLFLIHVEFV